MLADVLVSPIMRRKMGPNPSTCAVSLIGSSGSLDTGLELVSRADT